MHASGGVSCAPDRSGMIYSLNAELWYHGLVEVEKSIGVTDKKMIEKERVQQLMSEKKK